LLYQEFASLQAEEMMLKSESEIFTLMVKEMGPPLEIYRSILKRYEMYIDVGLQPNHVVKMA
jgi:hypothetical protein